MKMYFKLLGLVALLMVGIGGISILTGTLSLVGKTVTAPARVLNKALNTGNVQHKYEWFHDVYTQQSARVNQITQFKSFLSGEVDKEERRSLRMEMAGQQMSCRDLVAKYNANSEKVNVGIFKGWSLPDTLSTASCE